MSTAFTYYCETHREHIKLDKSPATRTATGSVYLGPTCDICNERMFWVPDGGTVVPEAGR